MEPFLKLKKNEIKSLKDAKKYRQLGGSCIYLNITRLDIACSVQIFSQFMQDLNSFANLDGVKQILWYIKGYVNYDLLYKKEKKIVN